MVFIIPCPNRTETSYTGFTKMFSLGVSTQEFFLSPSLLLKGYAGDSELTIEVASPILQQGL